jgi:nucleotide-binding universal stress UspA family protein
MTDPDGPLLPCYDGSEDAKYALERAGALPITVEATGPVWKTIVEIADQYDAATIVMGSRGLTGMRSMLLGSVSSAEVHHADRPTLVVHRPSDNAEVH